MIVPIYPCKNCGEPWEEDDMLEGYCPNCPTVQENVLDAAVIALEPPLRNVSEMDAD